MTRARWVTRANEHNRDDFETATYTFNALRWGATGNGSTDDTVAIQAMLDAGRGLGGTYLFPAGNYLVSDTLTITDSVGWRIKGTAGQRTSNATTQAWVGGTSFTWNTNDATKPFLKLSDVANTVCEDFFMKCTASTRCLAGIMLFNTSVTSHITTTSNLFRNVHFSGNTDGLEVGFLLPATAHVSGGSDNNNDYNHFEDCSVSSMRVAGALINHAQSKGNFFLNCQFHGSGAPSAKAGVGAGYWYDADTDTEYFGSGNAGTAGSFHWYGGGGSWVDYSFVLGQGAGDTYVISGANMEKMGKILYAYGTLQLGPQVLIQGSRFAGTSPTEWNADLKIIDFRMPGPLVLIGNRVEDALALATTISMAPSTASTAMRGALVMHGNSFESTNNTMTSLVTLTNSDLHAVQNRWINLTGDTRGQYENVYPDSTVALERTFTETTGAGTYTATITIPAGTYLLDVLWLNTALWTATTSAVLDVGDDDNPDGFFEAINLKAAPGAGLTISFRDGDTGVGAYSAAAGPMKYYSAAKTLTATVVTVGAAGTAGRSRLIVQYARSFVVAAAKV